MKNIKPALSFLQENQGHNKLIWDNRMNRILQGLIRRAASERKPIEKAPILPIETLRQLVDTFILPHVMDINKVEAWIFRAIFKDLLKFHTLCRFDDVVRLQAFDFSDNGENILINFRSAKIGAFGAFTF